MYYVLRTKHELPFRVDILRLMYICHINTTRLQKNKVT